MKLRQPVGAAPEDDRKQTGCMSDFFFARQQMAMSLAFHIMFAALGIGMPWLMAVAEGMYLRTGQPVYLDLSVDLFP